MIQIVIDISEKQYEIAKEYVEIVDDKSLLAKAIVNGTPLPKGHGRLIDADALKEEYKSGNWDLHKVLKNAPTIIEAESEG